MRNLFLCLTLAVSSTGCATVITGAGPTQKVKFASKPYGADVYVNDNYVGKTPIAYDMTRNDPHKVVMRYNGQEQQVDVRPGFNPWFLGTILIGGLIGMGVDLVAGSAVSLGPSNVNCTFEGPPVTVSKSGPPAPAAPAKPQQKVGTPERW